MSWMSRAPQASVRVGLVCKGHHGWSSTDDLVEALCWKQTGLLCICHWYRGCPCNSSLAQRLSLSLSASPITQCLSASVPQCLSLSVPQSQCLSASVPQLSASVSVPQSLSVSVSFPRSLSASVSQSHCLSLSASVSVPQSLSASVSVPQSQCLRLSLNVSVSVPLGLSASVLVPLSLSAPILVSPAITESLNLTASVSLPQCLSFHSICLSVSVSECNSVPLSAGQKSSVKQLGGSQEEKLSVPVKNASGSFAVIASGAEPDESNDWTSRLQDQ